jgi:hypothetical protein
MAWPKKTPQHTILVRLAPKSDDADFLMMPLTISEVITEVELNECLTKLLETVKSSRYEIKSVHCAWVGLETAGSKEPPRTCLIEALKTGDDNLVQDTIRLMSKRKWRDYLQVVYGLPEASVVQNPDPWGPKGLHHNR